MKCWFNTSFSRIFVPNTNDYIKTILHWSANDKCRTETFYRRHASPKSRSKNYDDNILVMRGFGINYYKYRNKVVVIDVFRSEERQYCWNCNSRISPRCGRRLSRHLARSVSVPPARNAHKSVPCFIRSKSMPYREKDTGKMPTSKPSTRLYV